MLRVGNAMLSVSKCQKIRSVAFPYYKSKFEIKINYILEYINPAELKYFCSLTLKTIILLIVFLKVCWEIFTKKKWRPIFY